MTKPDLKKLFQRWRHRHASADPLKRRARPFRDWHRLIVWWLILLLGAGAIHFYLFRNIERDISRGAANITPGSPPSLNVGRLHQVVEYWQARESGRATTTRSN